MWLTIAKYSAIDGPQRAASFAYYAFFGLFPLLLLLVAIGSFFFDPTKVGTVVINEVSHYMLVDSGKHDMVRQTIRGVVKSRRGVGAFAVLGLLWSALRFFQSLVHGVNRAWRTREYSWWRLPIQNLLMVGILASALIVGVVAPFILDWIESLILRLNISFGITAIRFGFDFVRFLLPTAVLFYGFSMFYMLAPRRKTVFGEVWHAALAVAVLLPILQSLLVLYTRNVAHFNAVYGAFGSVIAVLMWIYLSGTVIILGGCFCAAAAEVAGKLDVPPPLPAETAAD
jgi:Ca2+-transporting ATPase